MNFEKFLGKLSCRTPPSNHFSHDVVFYLFADHRVLQPKILFFWWSNSKLGEKTHKPIQPCVVMEIRWKLLSSCGRTCTHLGIRIAGEVEEKKALKNLLM